MRYLICGLLISISAQAQQEVVVEPKPIGATLIDGKAYDVYQTDQELIYKGRTEKSPNKEENPSFENILGRQTRHEIGFGMTFYRAADGTLTRPEQNGLTVYNKHFAPGTSVRYNFHPGKEGMRRFTFSGETTLVLTQNSYAPFQTKDGTATNYPSMSPHKNWAALAEYDLIIIPWFKKDKGAFVLSSGYALSHQGRIQQAGPEILPDQGTFENSASFRLRTISLRSFANIWNGTDDNRAEGWSYIGFRISNKGTWKLDFGYVIPFGRSANPKVVVEK